MSELSDLSEKWNESFAEMKRLYLAMLVLNGGDDWHKGDYKPLFKALRKEIRKHSPKVTMGIINDIEDQLVAEAK